MITFHDFFLDENNHQILKTLRSDFACICRYTDGEKFNRTVPWHWHPAVEINYVEEGTLEIQTPGGSHLLHKGDAMFVNANILHNAEWKDADERGRVYSILFLPEFLSGGFGNLMEARYLRPVLNDSGLQGLSSEAKDEGSRERISEIRQVITLFRDEPFGYEFEVRACLCRLWCKLLTETGENREGQPKQMLQGDDRIKQMLEYIHLHYAEKIRLQEIASAGNVSQRECNRCFARFVKSTPIDYLNAYRLHIAVHDLLFTEKSIAQVGESCGFSTANYFNKVFRKKYACTPGEYRKAHEC